MATKYLKLPVEQHLNLTDYEMKGYMPTVEALMFVNFIKEVNNGQEENETPLVHLKMMDNVFNNDKRCAILCHRGIGKLETENSPILTPGGWTTMGAISVGDSVIDRHGKATVVTYKTEAQYPETYLMTLTDGTTMEVGDEHKHVVWRDRRTPTVKRNSEKVMTTLELIESGLVTTSKRSSVKDSKCSYRFGIPLVSPIEFSYKPVGIDPYVLGLGLANGYYPKGQISCHADDMVELCKYVGDSGYSINSMRIEGGNAGQIYIGSKVFSEYSELRSGNKYIPKEYMLGSIGQRVLLLRGLMDGDGHIAKNGGCSYSSYNRRLATDVRDLARSLGAISYVKEYIRSDKNFETEYRTIVNIKVNPFRLNRKASKWKPTKKMTKGIVSLEPLGKKKGYCIEVSSESHTYIANGYTVTHNTTVFAEYLILFCAAFGYIPGFGKTNLILYVTDSIENGVKNLRRNVEFRYANSEFLQKLIPDKKISVGDNGGYVDPDEYERQSGGGRKFTDIRLEFKNNKGHTTIVKGYGAKTGVRGAKEMGQRPTMAILDDLVSDTDAESPTIIATIENTVYKAVSKALSPTKQKMIWLGTPFNARDPLYKAVESGAWRVSVYPICEEFPVEKKDFRGSWEDRFTYEYVRDEYEEAQALGMPANFNQELMLRIMSEEDRLVKDSDIRWYDSSIIDDNKANYNFYITTDFATSEKQAADFSVISVWAYTNNGDWLWVDGTIKRQLMDQTMNDVFRFVTTYKPEKVGIEVSGQQGGFIKWIEDLMLQRNIFFNLASDKNSGEPGIRPNGNKMIRFQTILPQFKLKKIRFPEDQKDSEEVREIINELSNASKSGFKSKHDDFIDTVSMLSVMDPWKPSEGTTVSVDKEDGIYKSDYVPESEDSSYDVI